MTEYDKKKAYKLRCKADAIERQDDTVTVELSVPVAWLLRDLLGFCILDEIGVRTTPDMIRLNDQLGYRDTDHPHVSGWSKTKIEELREKIKR
jgi:hypothetical protein